MSWSRRPGTLESHLDSIERIVRLHGWKPARRPACSTDQIEAAATRLAIEVPDDLRAFIAWIDQDLWSWFVNPDRAMSSDHPGGVINLKGEWITPDHPEDSYSDTIRIWLPSDWRSGRADQDSDELGDAEQVRSAIEFGTLDETFRATRYLIIGSTQWGNEIYYFLDETSRGRGVIGLGCYDDNYVVLLGHTLEHWLERLIMAEGVDIGVIPGDLGNLSTDVGRKALAEFKGLNPNCTYFED